MGRRSASLPVPSLLLALTEVEVTQHMFALALMARRLILTATGSPSSVPSVGFERVSEGKTYRFSVSKCYCSEFQRIARLVNSHQFESKLQLTDSCEA